MAPDPAHVLSTTDDERALAIVAPHPAVTVVRDPDAALVVTGPRRRLDLRRLSRPGRRRPDRVHRDPDPARGPVLHAHRRLTTVRPGRPRDHGDPMTARCRRPPGAEPPRPVGHVAGLDHRLPLGGQQTRCAGPRLGRAASSPARPRPVRGPPRPPGPPAEGHPLRPVGERNGFALALLVLGFAAQWVLPASHCIVAGDVFASEDQHGTWKTILTRSNSRSQIFWGEDSSPPRVTVALLVLLARPDRRRPACSSSATSPGTASRQTLLPGGRAAAGHRELGDDAAPPLGFTALAILLSVLSRNPAGDRRTDRPRPAHAALRRPRWHRRPPPPPAHPPVRRLARPAHPTPVQRAPRRWTSWSSGAWSVLSPRCRLPDPPPTRHHRRLTTIRRTILVIVVTLVAILGLGTAVVAAGGGASNVTRARLEKSLPAVLREHVRQPGSHPGPPT